MTSKKLGGFLIELFISYISQKKPDLCLPLPQGFVKTFAHENIKKLPCIHLQKTKITST